MARTRLFGILLLALILVACIEVSGGHCAEAWRAEFDQACEKTTDAMILSITELNSLIEKCARLEKIIETQDETVRKVYLKRLQMCRNMYLFALDAKQQEKQQN